MTRPALLLALLLLFVVPIRAGATTCYCYFGEKNDCQEMGVAKSAQAVDCELACKNQHKDAFKKYDYIESGFITVTLKAAECLVAHNEANPKPPTVVENAVLPKLSVDIPTVTFTPVLLSGGNLEINFLGQYIQGVYKFLLTVSGFFAVVLILVGGLQWVIGSASAPQIASGKKRIANAIAGLVLVFSVYLILYTVNPQLLGEGVLSIPDVARKDLAAGQDIHEEAEEEAPGGKGTGNKAASAALDCTSYPPKVSGGSGVYACGKDCAAQLPETKKSQPVKSNSLSIDTTTYLGVMDCFHANTRPLNTITTIAVHEGEASSGSLVTWMKKYVKYNKVDKKTGVVSVSTPSSSPVSSHYFIAENGKIYQITDERFVTYHGVKSAKSIGIDMDPAGCTSASLANTEKCHYTDAQYTSLAALINDIKTRTNVSFDNAHVLGHCEVNKPSNASAHVDPRGFNFGKIGLNHSEHKVGKCKFIGDPGFADWGVMPVAPPK